MALRPALERDDDDRLPVALRAGDRRRRRFLPHGGDALARGRGRPGGGTAPAWFALLTVVLVPLVAAVMRAERPLTRLAAGIGPPGSWSPGRRVYPSANGPCRPPGSWSRKAKSADDPGQCNGSSGREGSGLVSRRAHAGPDNEVQSAAGAEGEALGIAGGHVEDQPCIVPRPVGPGIHVERAARNSACSSVTSQASRASGGSAPGPPSMATAASPQRTSSPAGANRGEFIAPAPSSVSRTLGVTGPLGSPACGGGGPGAAVIRYQCRAGRTSRP